MKKKAAKKKRDKWEFIQEGEAFIAKSTTTKQYEKWTGEPMTDELLRKRYAPERYSSFTDEQRAEKLGKFAVVLRAQLDEVGPEAFIQVEELCGTLEEAREKAQGMAAYTVFEHNPQPRKWKLDASGETFTARAAAPGFDWWRDVFTIEAAEGGFAVVHTSYFVSPIPGREIIAKHETRERALEDARERAQDIVTERNPLQGSFTADGEPKECRECGQEGEDCECWMDEE